MGIAKQAQHREKELKWKCQAVQDYGFESRGSLHHLTGDPFMSLPRTRLRQPRWDLTSSTVELASWASEPPQPGSGSAQSCSTTTRSNKSMLGNARSQQSEGCSSGTNLQPGKRNVHSEPPTGSQVLQRVRSAPGSFILGCPSTMHDSASQRKRVPRVDYRGLGASFTLSLS